MPRLRLVPLLPLVLACALDLPLPAGTSGGASTIRRSPSSRGSPSTRTPAPSFGLDAPIAIPRGASELHVMPDGERLVVLDELEDQLLLLE